MGSNASRAGTLKRRLSELQAALDEASEKQGMSEGTYVTLCQQTRALHDDMDALPTDEASGPDPPSRIRGSARQRRSMIDAFFEQRAMNHATVWVDPSTDATSGEEKIAQLQNCLRYSVERTLRLEEQKAQMLVRLKKEASHHARYNSLKEKLHDVLSHSMIDTLKQQARAHAIERTKVMWNRYNEHQDADQAQETEFYREACLASRSLEEHWTRVWNDARRNATGSTDAVGGGGGGGGEGGGAESSTPDSDNDDGSFDSFDDDSDSFDDDDSFVDDDPENDADADVLNGIAAAVRASARFVAADS